MIVDFLTEILKFSSSPSDMADHLTRLLRELMGVRVVMMLQHDDRLSEWVVRIVAIEPKRTQGQVLVRDLAQFIDLHPPQGGAVLILRSSVSPDLVAILDRMGLDSLSVTPLRVGDLRVGTLMALDYPDHEHSDDVLALLDVLAPVFALTLQNALHFESQEARVVAQAEEYRTLLRTSPDGFLTVSGSGVILHANEAYLAMTGYTLEEICNLSLSRLEARETPPVLGEHIARIKMNASDRFLSVYRRKDGSVFPVEVSTTYVPTRGVFLSFVRDLTELKRAEEETARLQIQLQQSQKMESLGLLAGGVAHDMNNVLGAILGMASANIDAHAPESRTYRAFETIIKAAERGGKMVKGLLGFARHTPAEQQVLNLNAILQEEIRLLERTTLARISLLTDLDPDLRPIMGEASSLTHAFMNLCVNAVDAMPGSGTLTLRTRNLGQDWIEVVVEDTGVGMPKEVLERAMDPFFTTKGVGKGTGLGLSLVYSAIKAHQGEMEIQSDPGMGTRVRMRFPACAPPSRSLEAEKAPAPDERRSSLAVLVVDDDELIQYSTQALLELKGHVATTVSSGEEALAKIEAGYIPDVVILDMNMPGLGGAETLPRLRALNPTVPVLLATGRVDQFAVELARAHPHVTLLSKPFGLDELGQFLETVAGRGEL
ncbi:MAG: multi-sensor hybrid histidine kinase [Holophagaceae bacterium]|nr:multi-sensor hybrid histidine kinase [Holophagaceae bacterium]